VCRVGFDPIVNGKIPDPNNAPNRRQLAIWCPCPHPDDKPEITQIKTVPLRQASFAAHLATTGHHEAQRLYDQWRGKAARIAAGVPQALINAQGSESVVASSCMAGDSRGKT
jgi:hypothetical protein